MSDNHPEPMDVLSALIIAALYRKGGPMSAEMIAARVGPVCPRADVRKRVSEMHRDREVRWADGTYRLHGQIPCDHPHTSLHAIGVATGRGEDVGALHTCSECGATVRVRYASGEIVSLVGAALGGARGRGLIDANDAAVVNA